MKSLLSIKMKSTLLIMYFILTSVNVFSQGAAINSTGASPDPSAMLDISATDKGLLIPRVSEAQRLLILNPAMGLIVYQIDNTAGFWYYDGNTWKELTAATSGGGSGMTPGTTAGNTLYWDGSQWKESSNIYNEGNSVGIGTNQPDQSAILDISSTSKGALIPRMSTYERDQIANPASGLQIYNTTTKCLEIFEGNIWQKNKCFCIPPAAPTEGSHSATPVSITWQWSSSYGAEGYKYSTVNDFNTATFAGTSTSYTQNGLSFDSNYTLYVWAYTDVCISPVSTLTYQTPPCTPPVTPVASTHTATYNSVTWKWQASANALGYKFNTTNDYNSATDIGNVTSYTQYSLNSNTDYTVYVWAYNYCENPISVELTQKTNKLETPTLDFAYGMDMSSIEWYWFSVGGATGYMYNTVNDLTTATNNGNNTYLYQSGLNCNTSYTLYVWAYNTHDTSYVATFNASTQPPSFCAPWGYGSQALSENTIMWYFGGEDQCTYQQLSYLYNTTNDINTATNIGQTYSYTQTGLNPDTQYTLYVWYYIASCTTSSPITITRKTLPTPPAPTACTWNGSTSFSVTHTSGSNGAPETKTITYNQEQKSISGSSKCWITQNLGASQQATNVTDATEAAAGWYWQFNRTQGYKHNGSIASPSWTNTTYTGISEYSDWTLTNDPCNLLLGSGWRLPTQTEVENMVNTFGWSSFNAYNSVKLHLAGYISYNNGSLYGRGSYAGYYWSSTSTGNYSANSLYMESMVDPNYGMYDYYISYTNLYKTNGHPVRCLRD